MPRKPRLHVSGGLYHVILRGNNRQAIFHNHRDFHDFEDLLKQGLRRYVARVHGYCWMTNHIHLAVQVSSYPVGRLIQWSVSQYAKRLNQRLDRCGHVFEKRHRAILVETDAYLLGLLRYIHRNPIEAGMVTRADDYQWCSHRSYLGRTSTSWLTTDWVLSLFASRIDAARTAFDAFVHDDSIPSDDRFEVGCQSDERVLGGDDFVESIPQATNPSQTTLENVVQTICEKHRITVTELADQTRNRKYAKIRAEIAKTATELGVCSLADVARHLKRSDAVLCRSIQRHFPSRPKSQ